MDDEKLMRDLLMKMAQDSMRKKESPAKWIERLNVLKETIQEEIDAVRTKKI